MEYENFLYFPDRVIFRYPYSSTSMEWGLRRVVPAAAVTTHAKPRAQQQLARDLGVCCHGAALSASKFRRGAARQSAATSMAGFLVNCSSPAVQLQKKQSQSLRLDPYVSHREGSIVVLPAANLRGPPDKYGLLTLGRPSVRCYSTLRAWSPMCGSTFRVSQRRQRWLLAVAGLIFFFF